MKIAVIGSGYVGLVAAACFADLGHKVLCVDNDAAKIEALASGAALIHEDYLTVLLDRHRGRNLVFTTSLADAVRQALVIVIAVGTPPGVDGEADLSYVESVTHVLARAIDDYKLIVEKSTVPVYTNAWIKRVLTLNGCHRDQFDVASNPEFLREGSAVTDFLYPDRIVVGADSERALKILRELYGPVIDGSYAQNAEAVPRPEDASTSPRWIETSPQSAELIKHASNAFLAMKISFINAVANICEAVGGDIEDVRKGIGADRRIGAGFLRAGIGYGGSCFPKDIAAFRAVAREHSCQSDLLDAVHAVNEEQRRRFIKKVHAVLWTLKNKRLAVLGLAFKGGTDDIRESPAIRIVQELLKTGCTVCAYDPAAIGRAKETLGDCITYAEDAYTAMRGADALLILTDWKEFAALDLGKVKDSLNYPVVIDGRNLYSPDAMANVGLSYHSVGRASAVSHNVSARA